MLFRRRRQKSLYDKLRNWLWPRRSFKRSFRYIGLRIMRIRASAHQIALGLAIGVFAAATPLFGFHIIIAAILAWLLRANIAAAIIGTMASNPLTIPFIMGADYEIGKMVLHLLGQDPVNQAHHLHIHELRNIFSQLSITRDWFSILKPLFIGSFVLGGVLAIVVYLLGYLASAKFQQAKLTPIVAKSEDRSAKKD